MDRWKEDGRMDQWTDGRTNRQMDRQTDRQKDDQTANTLKHREVSYHMCL